MKKKTTTEKYIEKAVKDAIEAIQSKHFGATIENSEFNAVKWNADATETIGRIAEALHKNSQANIEAATAIQEIAKSNAINARQLGEITTLFDSQNIHIGTMVKVTSLDGVEIDDIKTNQ